MGCGGVPLHFGGLPQGLPLLPQGGDLHELRRHIYGDTVDFFTIKKLVQKVFTPCKCLELHQKHQDVIRVRKVLRAPLPWPSRLFNSLSNELTW